MQNISTPPIQSEEAEITEKNKTFAFLDLETTGIPELEFFKTKITEISIVACSVEHFLMGTAPRVLHKLTLCFNPSKRIDLKSSDITGLTNELLEYENKFDENAMTLLEKFLSQLQQPVCLISHNGEKFDFPLLKKRFEVLKVSVPDTLKCCDSLKVFKDIDEERCNGVSGALMSEDERINSWTKDFARMQKLNESTPKKDRSPYKRNHETRSPRSSLRQYKKSYALREIHKRFFDAYPEESHYAEADVMTLMKCALKSRNEFVNVVDRLSINFRDAKGF